MGAVQDLAAVMPQLQLWMGRQWFSDKLSALAPANSARVESSFME